MYYYLTRFSPFSGAYGQVVKKSLRALVEISHHFFASPKEVMKGCLMKAKRKRLCPAQQMAFEYLNRLVHQAKAQKKNRLPTVHELANDAGVSRMTMGKVVTIFKQNGIVSVRQGKGIIINDTACESEKETTSASKTEKKYPKKNEGTKWHMVLNHLEKDIIQGAYTPNTPLPPLKELSSRYGACPKTLKKALKVLVERKMVFAHKRDLFPLFPGAKQTSSSLLVIIRKERGYFLEHLQPYVQLLLQHCDQINSNVETAIYGFVKKGGPIGRIDSTPSITVPTDNEIDNSFDAHLNQLTSYDFNAQGIIHAMVHHILYPHPWRWTRSSDEPVEIDGYVVQRKTTKSRVR